MRSFLLFASLLLLSIPDASAQLGNTGKRLRIHVTPEVGLGAEVSTQDWLLENHRGSPEASLDALTLGAQAELVGSSRWTPVLGLHRWRFYRTCRATSECRDSGWSGEAGTLYSFRPRSVFRPFGGAVLGVQHWSESEPFLQGRVGSDVALANSPVALRLEARYHRVIGGTRFDLFLLSTGLRFAIPSP